MSSSREADEGLVVHLRNTDILTLEMLSFPVGMQPECYVSFSAPQFYEEKERDVVEATFWREMDE